MGFFTGNPVVQGNLIRKGDLDSHLRSAAEIKEEFGHFHDFSLAGVDGEHNGIAYYWARGGLDDDSRSGGKFQVILDTADSVLFDGAIWCVQVGCKFFIANEQYSTASTQCVIYWRGAPAATTYHKFGPASMTVPGMHVDTTGAAFQIASDPATFTGNIALVIGLFSTPRLQVKVCFDQLNLYPPKNILWTYAIYKIS